MDMNRVVLKINKKAYEDKNSDLQEQIASDGWLKHSSGRCDSLF